MKQNLYKLWAAMLMISGGIALWFSGIAAVDLWKYARLNELTSAEVLSWNVIALSSSRFAVEVDYQYQVNETLYDGKTLFKSPQFLNRFAAENYVKMLESKRWNTWYRESCPTISSLERGFPQKQCLQALLTVGVFAYFYFARSLLLRFA